MKTLLNLEKTLRTIELTQGFVTTVDDEDYERLNSYKWCVHNASKENTQYAIRKSRKSEGGKRSNIRMHSFIMNCPLGMVVDHIDGNGLNNQRSNLRLATTAENSRNSRISKRNTSGYKGVYFHSRDKKWIARIKVNVKYKVICYTKNVIEAAIAYNKAALEYYGQFASLNVIPNQDGAIQENMVCYKNTTETENDNQPIEKIRDSIGFNIPDYRLTLFDTGREQ